MKGQWWKITRMLMAGLMLPVIIPVLARASWSGAEGAPDERQMLAEIYRMLAALAARLADTERSLAALPGAVVQAQVPQVIPMIQSAHQMLQVAQGAIPAQPLDPEAPLAAQTQRWDLLHLLNVQAATLGQQVDGIATLVQEILETNRRVPALLHYLEGRFERLYRLVKQCQRDRLVLQEVYGLTLLESVRENDALAEKRLAQTQGMFDALPQQAAAQSYEQVEPILQRIEEGLIDADRLLTALADRLAYLRGTLAMDVAQMLGTLERTLAPFANREANDEISGLWLALERGRAIADELARPLPDLAAIHRLFLELHTLAAVLSPADDSTAFPGHSGLVQSLLQLRLVADAIASLPVHQLPAESAEMAEMQEVRESPSFSPLEEEADAVADGDTDVLVSISLEEREIVLSDAPGEAPAPETASAMEDVPPFEEEYRLPKEASG